MSHNVRYKGIELGHWCRNQMGHEGRGAFFSSSWTEVLVNRKFRRRPWQFYDTGQIGCFLCWKEWHRIPVGSLEVFQVSVESQFLSKRWLHMIWKSIGYAKSGSLLVSSDVKSISCQALTLQSLHVFFFRQMTSEGDSGPTCCAHKQDTSKAKAGRWILKGSITVLGTNINRNRRSGWPKKIESSHVTFFLVCCLFKIISFEQTLISIKQPCSLWSTITLWES